MARKEKSLNDKIAELNEDIVEGKEEQKKLEIRDASAKSFIEKLKAQNPWIESEKEFFGVAGHRYHFDKINIPKIREEKKRISEENDGLKRKINLKVDAMFEKTEA